MIQHGADDPSEAISVGCTDRSELLRIVSLLELRGWRLISEDPTPDGTGYSACLVRALSSATHPFVPDA